MVRYIGCCYGVMRSLADSATLRSILDRLATVQSGQPARWGRMSAHGMICHLADSFRGTMGEKPISHATGWPQRTVMKWFALYVPVRWPKGIPTRPEVEQGVGGTPPGNLERDRDELIRITYRFCDPARNLDDPVHPIFGKMSRNQWMRWGYLHMDHHLRQFGA